MAVKHIPLWRQRGFIVGVIVAMMGAASDAMDLCKYYQVFEPVED